MRNLTSALLAAWRGLDAARGHVAAGRAYFVSDGAPANTFDFWAPLLSGLGHTPPAASLPVPLVLAGARAMVAAHAAAAAASGAALAAADATDRLLIAPTAAAVAVAVEAAGAWGVVPGRRAAASRSAVGGSSAPGVEGASAGGGTTGGGCGRGRVGSSVSGPLVTWTRRGTAVVLALTEPLITPAEVS